jgi:hypothetical protein
LSGKCVGGSKIFGQSDGLLNLRLQFFFLDVIGLDLLIQFSLYFLMF